MESQKSRICSVCRQTRPAQHFPKMTRAGRLLSRANICLMCRAASSRNTEENDEGGGGGKQLQHGRNTENLLYEMELEAALQKELESLNQDAQKKDIFGASVALTDEKKKQAAQRELLDVKEENDKNRLITEDEPNPELAKDTELRREKITRLFSVTRSLARNYLASNNAKATAQRNFGIFSHTKQQLSAHKVEQLDHTNIKKALSTESSALFSQHHLAKEPVAHEGELLANAIKKGQKIFKG